MDLSAFLLIGALLVQFVAMLMFFFASGIGWLIDRWVGTTPLAMIVFLLLGFAAGVLNVMRVAGVVQTNTLDPPDKRQ